MSDLIDYESVSSRAESRGFAPPTLTCPTTERPAWWPEGARPPWEIAEHAASLMAALDAGAGGEAAWAALELAESLGGLIDAARVPDEGMENPAEIAWLARLADGLRLAVARARGAGPEMLAAKARLAVSLIDDGAWPGVAALRETISSWS